MSYFVLLPADFVNLAKSALYGGFYLSNFWFYFQQNSYFAVNSREVPLVHTWTLGVEEQYYIFWPLMLFVLIKFIPKNKTVYTYIIFLILLISSLVFAIFCTYKGFNFNYISFGYYSIFSRAYELLMGSI